MRLFEQKVHEQGYCLIAGIDEAGRGALAGPVVAAAVILPLDYSNGKIKDSKKLSASNREQCLKIINDVALGVGVGIISPQIIDEINILQATLQAMREAVNSLPLVPEFLLVDGNQKINISIPQQTIVGGDNKSISCAAASIVAKVTRDIIMEENSTIFPAYDFSRNKGYGTSAHITQIKAFGMTSIHRKLFKPKSLLTTQQRLFSSAAE